MSIRNIYRFTRAGGCFFLDRYSVKPVNLYNKCYIIAFPSIIFYRKRRTIMPNTNADQYNEPAIVDGWTRIAEEYQPRNLNEHEKAQVERASLAESQAKKTSFQLGNPIRFGF
jgi:hypothetical protein